eukprot:m.109996 g.109996  ORF g.109996 m.109996 type:complete len:429 (-) comp13383_c0_seq8:42-1328(-)
MEKRTQSEDIVVLDSPPAMQTRQRRRQACADHTPSTESPSSPAVPTVPKAQRTTAGKTTARGKQKDKGTKKGKRNATSRSNSEKRKPDAAAAADDLVAAEGEDSTVSLDCEKVARLKAFLLSSACCVVPPDPTLLESPLRIESQDQVRDILASVIPDVDQWMDRQGRVPIAYYMYRTAMDGLPTFRINPALNHEVTEGMRFCLGVLSDPNTPDRAQHIRFLAEAYQACQAEQARAVIKTYRLLAGTVTSLRDQLIQLADRFKHMAMETVIATMNPCVLATYKRGPAAQQAHILSGYLCELGEDLGMSGVDVAQADPLKSPPLTTPQRKRALKLFHNSFDVPEYLAAVAANVNKPDAPGSASSVTADAINTWLRLKMASEDLGFDRHLLLYDEDRASWYKEPPIASQKFNLFLCERTALELVLAVFGLA